MVAEIESKLSKLIKSIDFDNLCFKNNVFKVKKSNIPKLDIINLDYSEDYEEDNLYNLNISKYLEEVKVFYTPSILNSFNEANLKDDFIVFDEKLNWIYFNSNEKKFSQIDAVIEFDLFVKNLYYYYLLFDSIKSKNFCDHFDDANNQIVIYSEKKGIFKITYNNIPQISKTVDYKENINNLIQIIEHLDFKMFLKNNLFSISNISLKISLETFIEKSDELYENTIRDYELFSKKFEFDKFKDNLYKEKDKYFLSLREIINKIYTQAVSIPILISASTIASYKLPNEFFINSLILIIFIAYSIFYNNILLYYINDLKNLKKDFKRDFKIIEMKSGLEKNIILKEKKIIKNKINYSLNFITKYLIFLDIIILIAIIYILYNGFNLKI